MQVVLAERPDRPPINPHRFEYHCFLHLWALPLNVAVVTHWIPGPSATFDIDERWIVQRELKIRVLCFELWAIIHGPLFEDDPEEEALLEEP